MYIIHFINVYMEVVSAWFPLCCFRSSSVFVLLATIASTASVWVAFYINLHCTFTNAFYWYIQWVPQSKINDPATVGSILQQRPQYGSDWLCITIQASIKSNASILHPCSWQNTKQAKIKSFFKWLLAHMCSKAPISSLTTLSIISNPLPMLSLLAQATNHSSLSSSPYIEFK